MDTQPVEKVCLEDADRERLCCFLTRLAPMIPTQTELAKTLQRFGFRCYVNGNVRDGCPTAYIVHVWYFMDPAYKVNCTTFISFRKFEPLVAWAGQREKFDLASTIVVKNAASEWHALPIEDLNRLLTEYRKK